MVVIYADSVSPRLKYISSLLFTDILRVPVSFTSNIAEFENTNLPKLNYSRVKPVTGIFMECVDLLFEKTVKQQTITVRESNSKFSFFPSTSASDFEFDLLAASFYLVTRYEEYTDFTGDKHGRFEATVSLAYKHRFLQQPLVNQWAQLLKEKLLANYPSLVFPKAKFHYLNTIDIDNGYSYKGKGIVRTLGAIVKAAAKGNFSAITERFATLLNLAPDPFDKYALQKKLVEQYKVDTIYFFLFASKAKYDGGLSPHSKIYHHLIKQISSYSTVGIHPSYASHKSKHILQKEISGFFKIAGNDTGKSRQHFLKFKLPETYSNLIDMGIREDYSMGYASQPGFRASICTPYYFYDLKQDRSTSLKLIPVTVMDGTLMEYLKIKPEEAIAYIKGLMDTVYRVNGLFVSIWHERFFSDYDDYKPWFRVYEEMLKEAQRLQNK